MLSNAQDKLKKSSKFEVNEYVHDFGHIKQEDGDVTHVFVFKNITDSIVKLDTLEAECGCTIPSLRGVNKVVQPNTIVEVPVKYEASTHPSFDSEDFYKTITVYTSVDTFQVAITGYVLPNAEMKDYGNVKEKILFQDYGFNFGNVYHDAIVEKRYKFYNLYDETVWLDSSLTEVPSWIKVSTVPSQIKHGEKGELVIRYDASGKNDWSFVTDYIKIKFSASEEPINFMQTATILERFDQNRNKTLDPKIRIDTLTYNIGSVTKGDTMSTTVTIMNEGKSPLVLRKIDPTCSCIKLSESNFTLAPNENKTIDLTFYTRKSRTGTQKKKVYFISNDPTNPVLTFNVTGKTRSRE